MLVAAPAAIPVAFILGPPELFMAAVVQSTAWMLTTTGSEGSGAPSGGGSIRVQPDAPNRYRAEEHASTTMCDPAGAP